MIDTTALWKNHVAHDDMQRHYDNQLAKLTVPYQTHYVETRHGTTHVVTAGHPEHPALVFWHGMNINMTMWIHEINTFANEYYIIAPDCVGDTGRSAPNRLNRNTLHHGEWAADVLHALQIRQAHHVGISGGGWMILKLANVAPETILSATLASTGGFINVDWKLVFTFVPLMLFTPPDKLAYKFVKAMGIPGREPTPEEIRDFELIFHFKTERGVPALPDEQIRQLTAPTMILMGEHERPFSPPQKVIDRARYLLPDLRHAEIIPGVSHGMNGDDPALFERKLRQFLAEVAPETT